MRFATQAIQLAVAGLFVAAPLASSASAAILYSDNFSGSHSTALNGSAPANFDNTGGELGASPLWISGTTSADFHADGTVATTGVSASAYLPFIPNTGEIYQLSATLNETDGSNRWLALGFAQRPVTASSPRWADVNPTTGPQPVAWLLHRGGGYVTTGSSLVLDQTFLGPATASSANITDPVGSLTATPVDVLLILDTSAPLWSVTWEMRNHNTGGAFTTVRTASFTTNPTINYIGFTAINAPTTGQISNLQLQATPVPEPTSCITLLGLTSAGALRLRRRPALPS